MAAASSSKQRALTKGGNTSTLRFEDHLGQQKCRWVVITQSGCHSAQALCETHRTSFVGCCLSVYVCVFWPDGRQACRKGTLEGVHKPHRIIQSMCCDDENRADEAHPLEMDTHGLKTLRGSHALEERGGGISVVGRGGGPACPPPPPPMLVSRKIGLENRRWRAPVGTSGSGGSGGKGGSSNAAGSRLFGSNRWRKAFG